MLAESFEPGRGVRTLESETHGVQLVLPNFTDEVQCSVFVDGSVSTVELESSTYLVMPIVTCAPAGAEFVSPLKLRFPVGDLEDEREYQGSSSGYSDSEEEAGCDNRESYREALASSYKVSLRTTRTCMSPSLITAGDVQSVVYLNVDCCTTAPTLFLQHWSEMGTNTIDTLEACARWKRYLPKAPQFTQNPIVSLIDSGDD